MDTSGARDFILAQLKAKLPPERTYHSLEHTIDVYDRAVGIAEAEGVEGEDLELLMMAALYHDSGFIERPQEHETAGCELVRRVLPDYGFSEVHVERICAMIMATRIPQSPQDKLAMILCDADLDYLGRNDFVRIGNTLFAEMRTYGVLSTEHEWNSLQVRFLEQHAYFTPTNRALREPVKQQHLQRVREWLAEHPQE